jgi:hypothetical protein
MEEYKLARSSVRLRGLAGRAFERRQSGRRASMIRIACQFTILHSPPEDSDIAKQLISSFRSNNFLPVGAVVTALFSHTAIT